MKRLLIVSPHFCPVNAPDMQRVRMSLPLWVDRGWTVTVLTVTDPTPEAPLDPELAATLPKEIEVVHAACLPRWLTRWVGVGNVALRALPFLFLSGCSLLAKRRYSAVYFSTTMFVVMPFGRLWQWLYGVPYVLDLHDPWVTDFYSRRGLRPPGGDKYGLVSRVSRGLERWTLRSAAHVISVSPDYLQDIGQRHPWFDRSRGSVLPFGAPMRDFARVATTSPRYPSRATGPRLAYVGRLGPSLDPALGVLLRGLARARQLGSAATLGCVGTAYVSAQSPELSTAKFAREMGLEHFVHEQPERVAYLESLRIMRHADANVILGSADVGYTPSKIMACLAAGRPILALAAHGSSMESRMRESEVSVIAFVGDAPDPVAVQAVCDFILGLTASSVLAAAVPAAYTDDAIANAQLDLFARLDTVK